MKRYVLIIVAGAIIVMSFVFRTGFLAYTMYALMLLYLASWLMSAIWLRGIECQREIYNTVVNISELVPVMLTVKNAQRLPMPWVFLDEWKPPNHVVQGETARLHMFMPRQEIHMMYNVRFLERGYHRLGPLTMETGDIFGLHRRFMVGAARDYVTVLPRVIPIGEYDIGARKPFGEIKFSHRIYEDPTRIAGVREYVPGDSFNRIHWKISAATDQLHSKIYEPSVVRGATIILDFHESGYQGTDGHTRAELAVTSAASLANFLFSAGEQVGYFTNGRDAAKRGIELKQAEIVGDRVAAQRIAGAERKSDILHPFQVPTGRSSTQILSILESLARTELTDGLSLAAALEAEYRRFRRDATLVMIVPEVSEQLALTIGTLKSIGFSGVVFIIKNPPGADAACELLVGYNVPVIEIDGEHSLHALAFGEIPF